MQSAAAVVSLLVVDTIALVFIYVGNMMPLGAPGLESQNPRLSWAVATGHLAEPFQLELELPDSQPHDHRGVG